MEVFVFGAFRRQKRAFPKIKGFKMDLTQKSKVPKWVCRIIPRPFLKRPLPFSQYLAPLGTKYIEKTIKNSKFQVIIKYFLSRNSAKIFNES